MLSSCSSISGFGMVHSWHPVVRSCFLWLFYSSLSSKSLLSCYFLMWVFCAACWSGYSCYAYPLKDKNTLAANKFSFMFFIKISRLMTVPLKRGIFLLVYKSQPFSWCQRTARPTPDEAPHKGFVQQSCGEWYSASKVHQCGSSWQQKQKATSAKGLFFIAGRALRSPADFTGWVWADEFVSLIYLTLQTTNAYALYICFEVGTFCWGKHSCWEVYGILSVCSGSCRGFPFSLQLQIDSGNQLGLHMRVYVQQYHVCEGLGRSVVTAPSAVDKHFIERQLYQLSWSSWLTDSELSDRTTAVETNV